MAHESLQRFVNLRGELESSAIRFVTRPYPVFRTVTQRQPDVGANPELAFLQIVSWLYMYYFEAGRPGLTFLRRQADSFSPGPVEEWKHIQIVQSLRTSLQHNLELSRESDIELQSLCGAWFRAACQHVQPRTEDEWRMCIRQILIEAADLIEILLATVRAIEVSEFRDTILIQWQRELDRHHDPVEFDTTIEIVCADLGHEGLDVVAFRNRHLAAWRKRIDQLDDGFDFQFEARRMVEDALLSEWPRLLPITGTDIIRELGIPAGRNVGRALEMARAFYQAGTFGREDLLEEVSRKMTLSPDP